MIEFIIRLRLVCDTAALLSAISEAESKYAQAKASPERMLRS
jgi:hypothetical protein